MGKAVPPPLKADVSITEQFFRHRRYFVAKNKLSEKFFRLTPEEAKILLWFDGQTSVAGIVEKAKRVFPHLNLTVAEVYAFYQLLGRANLLHESAEFYIRTAEQNRVMRRSAMGLWAKSLASVIFLKFPLINPNAWIGWFAPLWKALFSPIGLVAVLSLWLIAITQLVLHFSNVKEMQLAFLDGFSAPLLWLALIFSKTLHEIGHAATCKAYGGNVNEMGICLICMTPCGYVDASDAWLMKKRRHRLAISAAGVYTELTIAALAALVWLQIADGPLRAFLMSLMVIASISTLLFNLNPLMKFDGYYVASDLLDIPNLRTKAFAYFGDHFKHLVFGVPLTAKGRADGKIFFLYTVCAVCYMAFITVSLSFFLLEILDPYGLKNIALAMGVFIFISLIGMPLIKSIMEVKTATRPQPGLTIKAPFRRAFFILGCLLLAGGGVSLLPSQFVVRGQGVIESAENFSVVAPVNGLVRDIAVREGDRVEAGDFLLRFENRELEADWERTRVAAAREEVLWLRARGSLHAQEERSAAIHFRKLEELQTRLKILAARLDELEVYAPVSGQVTAASGVSLARLEGRGVPQGKSLFRIDPDGQWKVLLAVSERDARLFDVGAKANGRLKASGDRLGLSVDRISSRLGQPEDLRGGHLVPNGGIVPLWNGRLTPEVLREFPVVMAEMRVDELPSGLAVLLSSGQTVRLKVQGEETTLGQRFVRRIRAFWDSRVG